MTTRLRFDDLGLRIKLSLGIGLVLALAVVDAALAYEAARHGQTTRALTVLSWGTLLVVVTGIAVGVASTRRIGVPLETLGAAARRIAAGEIGDDVTASLDDHGGDEIGALCVALTAIVAHQRDVAHADASLGRSDLTVSVVDRSK